MATFPSSTGGLDASITAMLAQVSAGNGEVEHLLIPRINDELRRLACHYMRLEHGDNSLQPTLLVNEAYLRLVQQTELSWENRAHFFGAAAQLMRHILVDHARARKAAKRGGLQKRVTLDEAQVETPGGSIDVLALHEAIDRLALLDPRQAQVVELRFFAGLTFEEIALVLKVGVRTAKMDWSMARDWLKGELTNSHDS